MQDLSTAANDRAITGSDELVEVYELLLEDSAPEPTTAIRAPRTWATYATFKDSQNQPLRRPPALDGVALRVTSAIPVDQSQGTANDASEVIMGRFEHLMIGMRSGLRIEPLRERYADSGQVGFLAFMQADIGLEYGEAFGEAFGELVGIIP